jgi:homeobox-leucine zipper protein
MNEREDTSYLREVNDKIRCENITMQQALKKIHCPQCGVQPVEDDDGFDAQKLRMENDRLREEVKKKSRGRPRRVVSVFAVHVRL